MSKAFNAPKVRQKFLLMMVNLYENLIEFGAALLYKGLEAAVDILEPL
jgi:hypothetical protein